MDKWTVRITDRQTDRFPGEQRAARRTGGNVDGRLAAGLLPSSSAHLRGGAGHPPGLPVFSPSWPWQDARQQGVCGEFFLPERSQRLPLTPSLLFPLLVP